MTHRFTLLDGIRGLAAIAVMLLHFSDHLDVALFPGGWIAVDVFFIMSGFVLMHSYSSKIHQKALSFGEFITLRAIRLGPLLYIGWFLGAFSVFFSCQLPGASCAQDVSKAIGMGSLMLPYFTDTFWPYGNRPFQSPFALNGPSWSLFFEMLVNILFYYWAARFAGPKRWWVIGMAFIGLVLAYHFNTSINGGWSNSNFYVGFPRVTYHFFVGAFLYTAYPRFGTSSKALAYLFIGMLFLAFCVSVTPLKMVTLFALAPLAVLVSAKVDVQGPAADFFKFLGDLSYPLYIVHWPVFQLLYLFVDFGQLGPFYKLAAMSLVTMGFAWALIYVDRYVRARLMRALA